MIVDATDEQSGVFALLENMQRADLNFYEEALAIQKLQYHYGFTQEQLAAKLGKSQSALSNKLRVLKLPPDIIGDLLHANLSERHARALLALDDNEARRQALDLIRTKGLSVAETERLIQKMKDAIPEPRRAPVGAFRDLNVFVNTLNHAVDTMRKAGIDAASATSETQEYIEYVVRIPKSRAGRWTLDAGPRLPAQAVLLSLRLRDPHRGSAPLDVRRKTLDVDSCPLSPLTP